MFDAEEVQKIIHHSFFPSAGVQIDHPELARCLAKAYGDINAGITDHKLDFGKGVTITLREMDKWVQRACQDDGKAHVMVMAHWVQCGSRLLLPRLPHHQHAQLKVTIASAFGGLKTPVAVFRTIQADVQNGLLVLHDSEGALLWEAPAPVQDLGPMFWVQGACGGTLRRHPQSFWLTLLQVVECFKRNEPVLLCGNTSCKSTAIQAFALLKGQSSTPVCMHENTEASHLIGQATPFAFTEVVSLVLKLWKTCLCRLSVLLAGNTSFTDKLARLKAMHTAIENQHVCRTSGRRDSFHMAVPTTDTGSSVDNDSDGSVENGMDVAFGRQYVDSDDDDVLQFSDSDVAEEEEEEEEEEEKEQDKDGHVGHRGSGQKVVHRKSPSQDESRRDPAASGDLLKGASASSDGPDAVTAAYLDDRSPSDDSASDGALATDGIRQQSVSFGTRKTSGILPHEPVANSDAIAGPINDETAENTPKSAASRGVQGDEQESSFVRALLQAGVPIPTDWESDWQQRSIEPNAQMMSMEGSSLDPDIHFVQSEQLKEFQDQLHDFILAVSSRGQMQIDHCVARMHEKAAMLLAKLQSGGGKQVFFLFQDGPVTSAAKESCVLVLEDFNLANQAVAERLNSLLESSRVYNFFEDSSAKCDIQLLHPFKVAATVHYTTNSSLQLSPAVRSRFTEIHVQEYSLEEKLLVVEEELKLLAQQQELNNLCVLEIIRGLCKQCKLHDSLSGAALNLLLKLIWFIDRCRLPWLKSLLLGIRFFFVDRVSLRHRERLRKAVQEEIEQSLSNHGLADGKHVTALGLLDEITPDTAFTNKPFGFDFPVITLRCFSLPVRCFHHQEKEVDLAKLWEEIGICATVSVVENLARILCASIATFPLLLEGPPGIGKTALVMAMGKLLGCDVRRLNVSGNTAVEDLFGRFVLHSVRGETEFRWVNGCIADALEVGTEARPVWVLLDELNLAPADVLVQLEPIMQQYSTSSPWLTYTIPVIQRRLQFHRTSVLFFATQNPTSTGGGRSKLPRGLQQHFMSVQLRDYAPHELRQVLVKMAAKHNVLDFEDEGKPAIIRSLSSTTLFSMFECVEKLGELASLKTIGAERLPMYNLRTVGKWLAVVQGNAPAQMAHYQLFQGSNATKESDEDVRLAGLYQFARLAFSMGLLSEKEQELANTWIREYIKCNREIYSEGGIRKERGFVRIGNVYFQRGQSIADEHLATSDALVHTPQTVQQLQSLAAAVQSARPVLLEGQTCSGKSALIRELAQLCGMQLVVLSFNSDTESGDFIGQWSISECQSVYLRLSRSILTNTLAGAVVWILRSGLVQQQHSNFVKCFKCVLHHLVRLEAECTLKESSSTEFKARLLWACTCVLDLLDQPELKDAVRADELRSWRREVAQKMAELKAQKVTGTVFKFTMSRLIETMGMQDCWVLLENIDAAPGEVLERLNSLFEETPSLQLIEDKDQTLKRGHGIAESWRIFCTANYRRKPCFKLSAAFLNRVISLWIPPLDLDLGQMEADLITTHPVFLIVEAKLKQVPFHLTITEALVYFHRGVLQRWQDWVFMKDFEVTLRLVLGAVRIIITLVKSGVPAPQALVFAVAHRYIFPAGDLQTRRHLYQLLEESLKKLNVTEHEHDLKQEAKDDPVDTRQMGEGTAFFWTQKLLLRCAAKFLLWAQSCTDMAACHKVLQQVQHKVLAKLNKEDPAVSDLVQYISDKLPCSHARLPECCSTDEKEHQSVIQQAEEALIKWATLLTRNTSFADAIQRKEVANRVHGEKGLISMGLMLFRKEDDWEMDFPDSITSLAPRLEELQQRLQLITQPLHLLSEHNFLEPMILATADSCQQQGSGVIAAAIECVFAEPVHVVKLNHSILRYMLDNAMSDEAFRGAISVVWRCVQFCAALDHPVAYVKSVEKHEKDFELLQRRDLLVVVAEQLLPALRLMEDAADLLSGFDSEWSPQQLQAIVEDIRTELRGVHERREIQDFVRLHDRLLFERFIQIYDATCRHPDKPFVLGNLPSALHCLLQQMPASQWQSRWAYIWAALFQRCNRTAVGQTAYVVIPAGTEVTDNHANHSCSSLVVLIWSSEGGGELSLLSLLHAHDIGWQVWTASTATEAYGSLHQTTIDSILRCFSPHQRQRPPDLFTAKPMEWFLCALACPSDNMCDHQPSDVWDQCKTLLRKVAIEVRSDASYIHRPIGMDPTALLHWENHLYEWRSKVVDFVHTQPEFWKANTFKAPPRKVIDFEARIKDEGTDLERQLRKYTQVSDPEERLAMARFVRQMAAKYCVLRRIDSQFSNDGELHRMVGHSSFLDCMRRGLSEWTALAEHKAVQMLSHGGNDGRFELFEKSISGVLAWQSMLQKYTSQVKIVDNRLTVEVSADELVEGLFGVLQPMVDFEEYVDPHGSFVTNLQRQLDYLKQSHSSTFQREVRADASDDQGPVQSMQEVRVLLRKGMDLAGQAKELVSTKPNDVRSVLVEIARQVCCRTSIVWP